MSNAAGAVGEALPHQVTAHTGPLDPDLLLFTTTFAVVHSVTYVIGTALYLAVRFSGWFDMYCVNKQPSATPPIPLLLEAGINAVVNHVALQWLFT